MGAWGVGIFENDSALDWMQDLIESNNSELLLKNMLKSFEQPRGLKKLFSSKEQYIDENQACSGLVAGEVIAAMVGNPSDCLPEELLVWVKLTPSQISKNDIELAKLAVKKIKDDSELAELWLETDEQNEWLKTIEDLEGRLIKIE